MEFESPATGSVRRRVDARHLLPAPPFAEIQAELGHHLAELAGSNAELSAARSQLASAIAACDDLSLQYQSLMSGAGTVVSEGERQSLSHRLRDERKRAISFTSMLRLHVNRLEYKVKEEMARIAEISRIEKRIERA